MTDFLVIGAGLAGLAFAREAQARGASVLVLEKSRGVGGRAATRRFAGTRVDHGAQFFTARTAAFQVILEQGLREGWIREWFRSIPEWRAEEIHPRPGSHPRYACPEGISALPKFLSQGLTIVCEAQVNRVRQEGECHIAETSDGRAFSGNTLIVNVPPVQLNALLPLTAWETLALEPCWVLLAALERDLAVDWPALELTDHPVFTWIARDHTKRAVGAPPTLVAHANPSWSEAHLDDDQESVADALCTAVEGLLGPLRFTQVQAHRWRYAKPRTALGKPYYWEATRRIGACGDWCEGGRVEGAFLSGYHLALRLLSHPEHR